MLQVDTAKATNLDAVTLRQGPCHRVEDSIDDDFRIWSRELRVPQGKASNQVGFFQGLAPARGCSASPVSFSVKFLCRVLAM